MIKYLVFISLTIILAACNRSMSVTMANIDDYLDNPDVQYVDLRESEEITTSGTIRGFSLIPFHSELVGDGIIHVPSDGQFRPSSILDEAALSARFDDTKTIYLICRTGSRTTFVYDALTHLGYDVINVGGIVDYSGTNRVFTPR